MTVELVVLDVNETLFPLDPIGQRLAEVGLHGQLELWFARVLRDGVAAAAAGRFASFADLARHHLEVLLWRHGRADGAAAGAVAHVLAGFDDVAPHPDVEPGLRALRAADVEVVALTNGSADLTHRFLTRSGLDTLVDAVHDVTETGRWKPAPEPYLEVVARHATAADRSAMVAVHPWDLTGAGAVGLTTGWLDRDGAPFPACLPAPDVQAPNLPMLAEALLAR